MYDVVIIDRQYCVVFKNIIFGGYTIVEKYDHKEDAFAAVAKYNKGRKK